MEKIIGYVRPVTLSDVPALLDIYSYYVTNTTISFEYTVPTEIEFSRRINCFSNLCPYLVYCEGDKILGYAYAHPAFERAAYMWCAETSIYLANEAKNRGLGKILYNTLIKILELQGYKKLYAIIEASNYQSCLFHIKNGYRLIASFPNAGYKLGRWLDVVWYERELSDFNKEPVKPISFQKMSADEIEMICKSSRQ